MHLKQTKRNGRVYLSVVQNYRENGKTKTRTIESLGYVDVLAQRFDDPVAHFQHYVAQLNEQRKHENPPVTLTFARDATIEGEGMSQARWGTAIALSYLDALGVHDYFDDRAGKNGAPAHAGRIFEMFACERMLHVAPKRETWQRRASFPRSCDFSLADAYAAFEYFTRNEASLQFKLAKSYQALRGPYKVNSVLLVLAHFNLADTGDVEVKRSNPAKARSMGIAMLLDREGMPMMYAHTSAAPTAAEVSQLVEQAKLKFGAKRVIVVSANLPQAKSVARALAETGDGYVFFRPLETAAFDLKEWVADASDYVTTQSGSYKVKSRVDEEDGMEVRNTVLWGRDYEKLARRKGSDAELAGYICIASSETKLSAGSLFHIYREVWRLSEPFQLLESDFSPSPYPVAHETHLHAHFLMCYAAFFALRLLRRDMSWKHNAAQVADALLRMEGTHLAENWYAFSYRTPVTDAIEEAAGVSQARRLRTPSDIKHEMKHAVSHIKQQ